MRKLRRADDLIAAGKTGEEIGAELGISIHRPFQPDIGPQDSRTYALRSPARPLFAAGRGQGAAGRWSPRTRDLKQPCGYSFAVSNGKTRSQNQMECDEPAGQ